MIELITFQDFLLYSLILSTVLMLAGLVFALITCPAPQPEGPEEEIVITSAPSWFKDLKAKSDEQLADPEAQIKIEIGKLQQMQIIESFNQASSLYPLPTPDNKPSDS